MRHGVRHFPALDALRGVAAVLIVLHHFRILSVLDNNLIVHSRLMVDLFFVISGFVIAYQYQQKLTFPRDVIGFQKRRFWRLYPLHLLMLGVFVGIETLKYLAYHVGHVQSIEPGFTSNPPMAILSNLLLVHSLGMHETTTFNFPSWSISVEFYTYLIFAVMTVLTPERLRVWCYVVMAVVGAVLLKTFGTHFTHAHDFGLFRCLFSFFVGAVTANVYTHLSTKAWQSRSWVAWSLMLLAGAMVYGRVGLYALPIVFGVMILTLIGLPQTAMLSSLLRHRAFQYLGRISYSVYMTHAAVIWGVKLVLIKVLGIPLAGGYLQVGLLGSVILTAGLLMLVWGVSHLTWQWVEEPFRIRKQDSGHATGEMPKQHASQYRYQAA